ncbi:hypothetical protein JCM19233_2241 [Vibrio astriarenae]|nr:hypothetical protein JCM19233_2241 [Vibrio sp. C7]
MGSDAIIFSFVIKWFVSDQEKLITVENHNIHQVYELGEFTNTT